MDRAARGGAARAASALVTAFVCLAVATSCKPGSDERSATASPAGASAITGIVLTSTGAPISGATVSVADRRTKTDARGRFRIGSPDPVAWVEVSARGFLPRADPAAVGAPTVVPLTRADGHTVSITFGGDVMFGRRFFDPNEDGRLADRLVRPRASAREIEPLLRDVEPALRNTDLAVVNLETPLGPRPYYDFRRVRPSRFHPQKDFAYASPLGAAGALRLSGVNVVDIGNNHLYDLLEPGVTSTRRALQAAGFAPGRGFFGGGRTAAQAWRPAVARARGSKIAFVGCTAVTREIRFAERDSSPLVRRERRRIERARKRAFLAYTAEDGHKGGAAGCTVARLTAAVRRARRHADVVVAMIHGGKEYVRTPSAVVRRLARAAARAGARIVVAGHPHVVGGLASRNGSLVAWSMGNLVFDQTLWPTFEAYLLTVYVRDGRLVGGHVDPLMIDRFTPRGVGGSLADYVVREAAGRSTVPSVAESGRLELSVTGPARFRRRTVTLDPGRRRPAVYRLAEQTQVTRIRSGDARLGRDLVWTGGFENETTQARSAGLAPLWAVNGQRVQAAPFYAHSGRFGVRLTGAEGMARPVVLAPERRILVRVPPPQPQPIIPGRVLSVVGFVRSSENATADVEVSWYGAMRGPSYARKVVRLATGDGRTWRFFRVDVRVPARAVAFAPFIRLHPPAAGTATVDVDDVAAIAWAPPGTRPSALYDHLDVRSRTVATVARGYTPGAAAYATPAPPRREG